MNGLKLSNVFFSFPKSGRTWLKALYGKYLSDLTNRSDKHLFDFTEKLTIPSLKLETNLPLIDAWTHDVEYENVKIIIENSIEYKDVKFIFMRRDLRDTLVSYYYHNKYRSSKFSGILKNTFLEEFLKIPNFSPKIIIQYYEMMERMFNLLPSENLLIIDYEECLKNPSIEFEQMLKFTAIPTNYTLISNAIKMCEFDNLKRLESEGYFPNSFIHRKNENQNSFKVRVGKMGQHKIELSNETI